MIKKCRSIFACICLLVALTVFSVCSGNSGYSLYYKAEDIHHIDICEVFDDPNSASQKLAEYSVIYTLSDEEVTQLVVQLKNTKCREYWNDPQQCIRNYAIMVHYSNGSIEILSTTGCGIFWGNNGEYNRIYFDEEVFDELIGDYIEASLKS